MMQIPRLDRMTSTWESQRNWASPDRSTDFGLSGSDTATLTSSIFNYRWENGRRYHAFRDGEYWYA